MEKEQKDILNAVGRQIANGWIESGCDVGELDMDYVFNAAGDNDLVHNVCESADINICQEWDDVWGAVRDGYQEVVSAFEDWQDGPQDPIIG